MKKLFDLEHTPLARIREKTEESAKKVVLPLGTVVEQISVADIPAEWVRAYNVPKETKNAILYFHGGGLYSGSCATYRYLATKLSEAAHVPVLVVEYRLAPEHKYPAANKDVLEAYLWLCSNGFSNENIILGGDSAGGGLVLMTLQALRDTGATLPAAAFMMSPWADMINFDGESYINRATMDPLCDLNNSRIAASFYIDSEAEPPEELSPISRDLGGLPPLLVQVGENEVLYSDSQRLVERATKAGVDVKFETWDNMWHVFQFYVDALPEANQAIGSIGKFVRKHFSLRKS
ncbi:MAG: Alpha/beta hydrolase fold-3 domain protein [Firmicutes bacterium]|nr:Alpha/beta hydrolase fold-3 domain protein [Bacillota bacterium]